MELTKLGELVSLKGKTAIVTGGAMGIGFGIAYRLAEAGANVAIADLNVEAGESAVKQLAGLGRSSAFIKIDVSQQAEVEKAVAFAVEKFGGLNILVNNAGIYPMAKVLEMPVEEFEKILAVNLKSAFMFTKAAATVMIKQNSGGKIINITSIDALHPSSIGLAVYDASKHGLWGFTKNTALELAAYNIQVNAIAPGGIATPGAGGNHTPTPEQEAQSKKFLAKIPMSRIGLPDDIGKVALFLASDLSSYMTGSQVVVDGGSLLSY